jgi:small acid-soluble spore protein tlp
LSGSIFTGDLGQLYSGDYNQKMKQTLKGKNERRMDALGGMRHEIKDEAKASKNRELQ